MSRTPKEHLDWCVKRAMEHMDTGQSEHAVTNFLHDVTLHEGTAWIADSSATTVLFLGTAQNPEKFRQVIEGFKV